MPRSIILRFGTKNLDKARRVADRIRKRLQEATAEGSKAREFAERLIRENEQVINRARGAGLADRGRAIRRANFQGGRERPGVFEAAQPVASKILEGYSAVKSVAQGNLLGGASFAASFLGGPAGIVAQAATLAFEQVKPFVERENERQRQQFEDRIAAFELRLARERASFEEQGFRRQIETSRRFGRELRAIPREQRFLSGADGGLGDL